MPSYEHKCRVGRRQPQRCGVTAFAALLCFALVTCLAQGCKRAGDLNALSPPTPSGPLQAQVSVEVGREIRRIPPTVYGTNVEWIYDGYGIWDRKTHGLQPEIVRLTRQLGCPLIRFPGGGFSDFYHWRDGVGPQEARPETHHMSGSSGPVSRHTFGTDEVLAFAEQTGAQLLFTVNAGTGSAEEAASWVAYVRQKAGTHPTRVPYWEVGNELYMKGDDPSSKAISAKPETYAERFLQFAQAMRAADPSIVIGAIGGENQGRYALNSYRKWDETVLGKAGDQIDFIAVHNAYAPIVFRDKGLDARTVYAAMLAAPVLTARNLRTVSDQIDAYAPARAAHIKIAVTEWGPLFHVAPDSRFVDHVKTLGSAVYVASVLKAFVESPRTEIANFFKLVDNAFMGWIGLRGGTYIPKAPYLALQMYTRHFGTVLVGSAATSPTYDSPAVGLIDRVEGVPYVEALASRSDDGDTLYLMAINKHLDARAVITFTLNGFIPQPDGVAWTLDGTALDANSGTELPAVPGVSWAEQAQVAPNSRFKQGAPNEVHISSEPLHDLNTSFRYSLPPHAVASIELRRRRPGSAKSARASQ